MAGLLFRTFFTRCFKCRGKRLVSIVRACVRGCSTAAGSTEETCYIVCRMLEGTNGSLRVAAAGSCGCATGYVLCAWSDLPKLKSLVSLRKMCVLSLILVSHHAVLSTQWSCTEHWLLISRNPFRAAVPLWGHPAEIHTRYQVVVFPHNGTALLKGFTSSYQGETSSWGSRMFETRERIVHGSEGTNVIVHGSERTNVLWTCAFQLHRLCTVEHAR